MSIVEVIELLDSREGVILRGAEGGISEYVRAALHGEGISAAELNSLRRQRLIEYLMSRGDAEKISFRLVDFVRDVSPHGATLSGDVSKWAEVFGVLIPHLQSSEFIEAGYERERQIAKGLSCLRKYGFNVSLFDGVVSIDDAEYLRVAQAIDYRVGKLGISFLGNILKLIAGNYSQRYGRYLNLRTPGIAYAPWGYLWKLACKHTAERRRSVGQKNMFIEAMELADALCGVQDVRDFHSFTIFNESADTILSALQRSVLADQFYSLEQLSKNHLKSMVSGIFGQLADQRLNECWTFDGYVALMNYILDSPLVDRVDGFHRFRKQSILTDLSGVVSPSEIDALLRDFSHRKGAMNAGFIRPDDNACKDYNYKPLVDFGDDSFVYINAPIFNYGFYEVLSSSARASGVEETIVGDCIEGYVAEVFRSAGVKFLSSEKYSISHRQAEELNVESRDGECDFILETEDTIIFMEVKKKILTRAAQSGDIVTIIVDLIRSVFVAQTQAGGHELLLRKYGRIDFQSGAVLEFRDRRIEKVSLTAFDFCSLHDNVLLQQIMRHLVGNTISVVNENKKAIKLVREVNECLRELDSQYMTAEFSSYRADINPYMGCRFISIPQLLQMLEGVGSVDDFKANLFSTKYLTTGSRDWFSDFAYWSELKASGDEHSKV